MAFRGIQSTNIISTEVGFTDPILILNKDGSTAVDVGFLGKTGATSYAGLVKDSATDGFLLINSINLASTSVNSIDATDLSLVKGDLTAGAITATSFTGDGSALTGITDTDTTYSVGDGGLTQNNFTNTLKNKLDTIEMLADVTDTANVKTAVEAATSIALGGSPTTTTQSVSDNSTKIATTAYTDAQVATVVDSAPGTLNTLNELAAALGDDANFSTTTATNIAAKLPLAGGTMTGTLVLPAGNGSTGGLNMPNINSYITSSGHAVIQTDATMTYFYGGTDGVQFRTSTNSARLVGIDNTGNVTIDSGDLDVTGNIVASGDITAYSDESLKTNIQVINNAVGKVEQLHGITFDRIEDGSSSTGVIAQELKAVLPEAVHTNEQGLHSVAYGNVVGLLIEAIKEQQKQIDELRSNKS